MIQIIPQYNGGDRLGQSLNNNLDNLLDTYKKLHLEEILSNRQEKRAEKERQRLGPVFKAANLNPAYAGLPEAYGLEALRQQRPQKTGIAALSPEQIEQNARSFSEATGTPLEKARGLFSITDPKIRQEAAKRTQMERGNEAFGQIIGKVASGQPLSPQDFRGLNQKDALEAAKLQLHQKEVEAKTASEQGRRQDAIAARKEANEIKSEINKQNQELRQQTQIEKNNAPYLADIRPARHNAEDIYDTVYEMERYLNTGKVASGVIGRLELSPKFQWLQSDESQRFDALGTEFATKAAAQTGIASNYKIRTQKEAKANLANTPKAQRDAVNYYKKQAKKVMDEGYMADAIINNNNGKQPQNLGALVTREVKEMEKIPLPKENEYQPGSIIKVGGYRFELNKNRNYWIPLGKALEVKV